MLRTSVFETVALAMDLRESFLSQDDPACNEGDGYLVAQICGEAARLQDTDKACDVAKRSHNVDSPMPIHGHAIV